MLRNSLLFVVTLTSAAALPHTARAQTVSRGPYLQRGTPTSMTVVWRTSTPTVGYLYFVEATGTTIQAVAATSAKTQHELVATGLTPNTQYLYAVGTSTAILSYETDFYFNTSPAAASKTKFRAWIVGDSGTGGTAQKAVRNAMLAQVKKSRPNIFLHMGDMAYGSGTNSQFQTNFFDIYTKVLRNTVCWPTLGNHEADSSSSGPQAGPYYDAYVLPKAAEAGGLATGTEAYYSFDHANVHFVVLDSHDSPRTPTGAMLTWLQADLLATSQPWLVAFWHHPPYTKGTHDSDSVADSGGRMVDMRTHALPILEAAGVDLVLAGHSHVYERSYLVHGAYATPTSATGKILDATSGKVLSSGGPYKKAVTATKGAIYVVAGHGGAGASATGTHPLMYFTEPKHGSVVMDVDRNVLSLFNVRDDGVITDRVTLIKGNGLVIGAPDGGETLIGGTSASIKWATVGSIPQVKLDYSTNSGATWTAIAGPIANTGLYTWTVPAVASSTALVRVVSTASATVYDDSNAFITISPTPPIAYVSMGATWKYDDTGTDLGTSWRTATFNDSGWSSGAGQLGYGDSDEATVLSDSNPNDPSVYFRKKVNIFGKVTAATLKVLHDDGMAVWVNDTLVASKYVGNGLSYAAFASSLSSENEVTTQVVNLSPTNPFVDGENIIAAMVKQADAASSDVSFDVSLTLTVDNSNDVAPDTFTAAASGTTVTYTVKVCNKGAAKSNVSVDLWHDLTTTPTCATTGANVNQTVNLAANGCQTLTIPATGRPAGIYKPAVLVDASCAFTETSEANNVKTATVDVGAGTADVSTASFSTSVSGSSVTFAGMLCQTGATTRTWEVKLWFDLSTAPTCTTAPHASVPLVLSPGTCVTFNEVVSAVPAGSYVPWVMVDGLCQITESSETNNAASAPFNIAP